MPSGARILALRVTQRVRRDGAWIQDVLAGDKDFEALDARDRAFATALIRGTVAHSGTLDAVIDRFAARPSQIEPLVRDALRLATYELLYLSTPRRAVVNEGVALVRSVQPRAAGFSNAVLRKISDAADDFPFGDPDRDVRVLALQTGHPEWLAERLVAELGEECARRMMLADESQAPLYVATNPFLISEDDLFDVLLDQGCRPERLEVPGAIRCGDAASAVHSDPVASGSAVVSDLSAQAITAASPLEGATLVADVAAGRGTKTFLLQASAVRQGAQPSLIAVDLHDFKARILRERMEKLHVPRVRAVSGDATDAGALAAAVPDGADLVFVDAPCSGLGTLRRHPEKRWRLRPQDIDDMAALSERILGNALSLVRPEGFVVYSTCTVTTTENRHVVEGALARSDATFEIVPIQDRLTSSMRKWATPEGFFQSVPEPDGPDGHFAAILRRR